MESPGRLLPSARIPKVGKGLRVNDVAANPETAESRKQNKRKQRVDLFIGMTVVGGYIMGERKLKSQLKLTALIDQKAS